MSEDAVRVENASIDLLLDGLGAGTRVACAERSDGVRGLFAKTSLKRGEAVLEVPLGEYGILDDPSDGATWSRQLGRRLVDVRRRGNEKKNLSEVMLHYAMSLPKFGAPAVGLANDPSVAKALVEMWDCAESVDALTAFGKQVADSYASELALDPSLTDAEWRWALSMVHSRTFRIEDERGRRPTRRALVAAADLINHSSDSEMVNCEWTAYLDSFVVSATRDVPQGEELLISYGEQCDGHFALFYGFIPNPNPHNRVKLFLNGREAVDWYQDYVGVPKGAPGWETEKERVVKLVCDARGKYAVDAETKLRRRVIQDLYLEKNGVSSESLRMLFDEMCGDEALAMAAVRARAAELREKMTRATRNVDEKLDGVDEHSRLLVREYRRRKIELLERCANAESSSVPRSG